MKPEQIAAIKRETEIDKNETGMVLSDSRTRTFLLTYENNKIDINDLVVQMYTMGWEDYRDSDNR